MPTITKLLGVETIHESAHAGPRIGPTQNPATRSHREANLDTARRIPARQPWGKSNPADDA